MTSVVSLQCVSPQALICAIIPLNRERQTCECDGLAKPYGMLTEAIMCGPSCDATELAPHLQEGPVLDCLRRLPGRPPTTDEIDNLPSATV